ncbi:phage tail assembly chaperone [Pseudomonas sp. 1176_21]|uniref:phage tail assembly chaperone n=1 Tax=Pseudomonas sp. 1176_21 TaxID=2604453 RepID=UPI0040630C0D
MLTRFYSQSTGCTYMPETHDTMPDDAVQISEQIYHDVIANPAQGMIRSHDAEGRPILVAPPQSSLSPDELFAYERGWRDDQVNSTEWLVNRHRDEQDMQLTTTLQAEQFAELLQYRQALRDWPQSELFPAIEHRPEPPAWLADMTP